MFRDLVLARIIEPTSKLDSARVLEEVGVPAAGYATVKRRLPVFATPAFRKKLAAACARQFGLGPASLVLYDVSTLYSRPTRATGSASRVSPRSDGSSHRSRSGCSRTTAGPLMVEAFEGNKAETLTMLPTIRAFTTAHGLPEVTIVADAGMVSEANKKAIEQAGLSFILGARIPSEPYVVTAWRKRHPDQEIPGGLIFTQPWPAGPVLARRIENALTASAAPWS